MINRDNEVTRAWRNFSTCARNEDKIGTGIYMRIDLTNIFFL